MRERVTRTMLYVQDTASTETYTYRHTLSLPDARPSLHNPRFPRIRPLALALLPACGAGASLPAMAGTLCVLYDTETGTQGTGGAETGTEDAIGRAHV